MPKQIIATVSTQGDSEAGPDYALIEIDDDGRQALVERMRATNRLADEFGGGETDSGPLHSTTWWLCTLPLRVTWLRYEALLDEDGAEPGWMRALNDENVVAVEDLDPRLGEPDEFGRPEYRFMAVDLERVRLVPFGRLAVEAKVEGTPLEFATVEVPVGMLI